MLSTKSSGSGAFSSPGSGAFSKVFEELPPEVVEEVSADALFEDIFDQGVFEQSFNNNPQDSNFETIESSGQWTNIPIGTFLKSQQSASKLSKKKELRRAIRKSTDKKVFQNTLFEKSPRTKRKKSSSSVGVGSVLFFSPILTATDWHEFDISGKQNENLDFLLDSSSFYPPPLDFADF